MEIEISKIRLFYSVYFKKKEL